MPDQDTPLSPLQKFSKEYNALVQGALMNGLPIESVVGVAFMSFIFYLGPAFANSMRQADMMMRAREDAKGA